MQNKRKGRSRRPLTHEDLELEPVTQPESEGDGMEIIMEKASLKDASLEERRREANKPLYLVRYE